VCRNLELLVSLPGGDSVRGFFMVTLLVELAAVPALRVNIFIHTSRYEEEHVDMSVWKPGLQSGRRTKTP